MKNVHEEEATQIMEEEKMAREMEVELQEEDAIEPITYEPNTQPKPSLTGGYLPFNKIGIVPQPDDRVMDLSSFTFEKLKKRIVQERRR